MGDDDETKKVPRVTDTELLQRIADDVKGLRGLITDNADRSLREHEATRRYVARLTTTVRLLWSKVFGSDPPPPANLADEHFAFAFKEHPTDPGKRRQALEGEDGGIGDEEVEIEAAETPVHKELPVAKHLTNHDLDIAGIQGNLIALSSKTNELLLLQKEQMGRSEKPARSLAQRIADGVAWVFTDREGRKFALLLIGALGGLVAAFRPHPVETVVRYEPAPVTAPTPRPWPPLPPSGPALSPSASASRPAAP